MMSIYDIDISIMSEGWHLALPEFEDVIQKTVHATLNSALPKNTHAEISIVLANDTFIQKLNATYRQKNKPTNVLSFPMTEQKDIYSSAPLILGDIIIAIETIIAEAKEQDKSLQDHFIHMLVHGCLHLLHYDHETENDANIMEKKEIALLKKFDIKNPYKL